MTPQPDSPKLSSGTLVLPADTAYLSLVDEVVLWYGKRCGLSHDEARNLSLAVDEACTNVINYAFPDKGAAPMPLVFSPLDDGCAVTILVKGRPFNPKDGLVLGEEKRKRDVTAGSRGLILIHQFADEAIYRWNAEKGNQFTTLTKHRHSEKSKGLRNGTSAF